MTAGSITLSGSRRAGEAGGPGIVEGAAAVGSMAATGTGTRVVRSCLGERNSGTPSGTLVTIGHCRNGVHNGLGQVVGLSCRRVGVNELTVA